MTKIEEKMREMFSYYKDIIRIPEIPYVICPHPIPYAYPSYDKEKVQLSKFYLWNSTTQNYETAGRAGKCDYCGRIYYWLTPYGAEKLEEMEEK